MRKIISAIIIGALFCGGIQVSAKSTKSVVVQNFSAPQSVDNIVGTYPNKINLIFSDIDGTILRLDKGAPKAMIPAQVKQTVNELKEAKVPLILVTGRSYFEAKIIADEIGNDNIFVITDQGAIIWDKQGVVISCDKIKFSDVLKIYKSLVKFQKTQQMDFGVTFCTDKDMYSMDDVKMPYNWQPVNKIKSIKELNAQKPYVKIVVTERNQRKLRMVEAFLKRKFPKYKVVVSTDCYCDIGNAKANKGEAVKKVAEMLGVDLKNVAVFGDAENDSSMFDVAREKGGLAISVRNAMPKLHRHANYRTKSVLNCGFSYGVDKILKNNEILNERKN